MERWVQKSNSGDFRRMAEGLGVSEDIARILVYRGVDTPKKLKNYLYMSVSDMHSPLLMDDMEKASDIIIRKIIEKKHIRIVGDYDVDGIMSTYILLTALKYLGANVDYVIPDRINDGYGINMRIIGEAREQGVDTILTCDNGIAAIEQIKHAKKLGMDVVVTDHHDIVFREENGNKVFILPDADAVVNPHRPESKYPFKEICGGVVAYKLIKQIYDVWKSDEVSREELAARADSYIEFAGIATVCDIMPLMDENRVIVRESLKMLEHTKNPGLRALIRQTGALKNDKAHLDVYHLGFIIGPCFNASGRLKTASIAIELLSCEDEVRAAALADELVKLNAQRKQMTEDGAKRIFKMIDESELKNDKVIVAFDRECHESIAGIIAGRIRERYNRPAFVITSAKDICKGSGRSIEGYNMFEELTGCCEYLGKFGGHPMAAGISIREERIDDFRKALNKNCRLTGEDMVSRIAIDIVRNPAEITEGFINELKILEPFGTGNEKPIFAAKGVRVLNAMLIGKMRSFLKAELECGGKICQAIYFGDVAEFENRITERYGREQLGLIYDGKPNDVELSILYYPQINEFRNTSSIQIVIKGYNC